METRLSPKIPRPQRAGRWFLPLAGALLILGLPSPTPAQLPPGKVLRMADPPPVAALQGKDLGSTSDPVRLQDLLRRRSEAEQRVRTWLGPHGVSRKGQAQRLRRLAQRKGGEICAEAPEELQVILVRIAFETDRSGSLTSITEDGNFLLEPDESYPFDPPPHNKAYFEAHLEGLARYWNSMSGGALQVNARVLPEGDEDAYFLSDIADYGPGSGGFWTIDALVTLVQDMIRAADAGTMADGSVNLAEFDFDDPNTYVIFAHAGGDLQSNLVTQPGDPDYSPNDIPTFFVQLGDDDVVPLASVDPDSGQPGLMTECSVIPEATSQDGLLGSIAAALYHEFGHALGLPDLYSTFTGFPTVGFWDLMDNGTNLAAGVLLEEPAPGEDPEVFSVVGLLPPGLSIWSKWYLGWVDTQVAGGRERKFEIVSTHRQDDCRKALMLPTSGDEFFLAEARWIPPAGEPNWALISDPETGVVQYLGVDDGTDDPPNTHQYDFYIPWAGGMFLWRVRQDRIEATVATNQVQSLPYTLGVELIEADGIKDIGVLEFATRGFIGSETDAFRTGSSFEIDPQTIVEYPTTATEVSPRTIPDTDSTFGFPTGAAIRTIPESAEEGMFVQARVEGLVSLGDGQAPTWPVELPRVAGAPPWRGTPESLSFFRFGGGDNFSAVVEAQPSDGSAPPSLFAYRMDASPRYASPEVFQLGSPLAGPMVRANDFVDDRNALLAVERNGTVNAFANDAGSFSQRSPFPVAMPDSVDTAPVVVGNFVLAANLADNVIHWASNAGATGSMDPPFATRLRTGPVPVSLGEDPPAHLAYVAGGSLYISPPAGTPVVGPVPLSAEFNSAEEGRLWIVAWPDPEGGPDRVAVLGEEEGGRVLVMRAERRGDVWSATEFGRRFSSLPITEPALGDLDGDGRLELCVATERRVWARNDLGVDVTGFPVRLTQRQLIREIEEEIPAGNLAIADVDGNGLNELLVGSTNGLTYAFAHDGTNAAGWPRRVASAGAANLVVDYEAAGDSSRALLTFEARGDTLRSGGILRSARITAVDLGPAPVLDASERPGEWLGLGGGDTRDHRGNRGARSQVTGPTVAIADQAPSVYPNPVRGNGARVRFFSGRPHTAAVSIYSLEGELIRSAEQFNAGGATGEVALDLRFLVPGPYVCRLEYEGRAGRETEFLTVYIE